MPRLAYRKLVVEKATLSEILTEFGAPTSKASMQSLLGTDGFSGLRSSEPTGDSCAYYIDRADPTVRAFQLCFNSAFTLTEKAIVSTSG